MLTLLYPLLGLDKPAKECLQCGKCCSSFGGHLRASAQDLARWRAAGRLDLLDGVNSLGWIWVDPLTKQMVSPCPHIDRSDPEYSRCAIYELRPDICRDYPTLAHGRRCLSGVFLAMWLMIGAQGFSVNSDSRPSPPDDLPTGSSRGERLFS